jgi:glucuronate isomerase
MRKFMDENFLLFNETAIKLFNQFAKDMPIYDYHCHLNPKEIWENKRFKNITEVWLYGDHYKWRAMRSNGIDEEYITGSASDYDKFLAWARTIKHTIGNPLYHWTHLELQRYFGINDILSEKTADVIWEKANTLINSEGFSVRDFIKKSNVKVIGTTDDPLDNLEYHIKIRESGEMETKVLPSFRPDKAVEISRATFKPWVEKLAEVCNKNINSYEDFLNCLQERIDFFHEQGCRISDHALDSVPYAETNLSEVSSIFNKVLAGEQATKEEVEKYRTFTLQFFARAYSRLGWAMQLHIAALRNNNTRMFKLVGADIGFDSINDESIAYQLSRLMDSLESESMLPKTILYTLNPKDNYVLGTMIGNFQGSGVPGKIQFGSGWWFNDQKEGMLQQMSALANLGLLSRFIGMLTDSRSFLSYTRHEYFRRILCNFIGGLVENGEYPNDMEALEEIIRGISFENAKNYFNIEL